MQCVRLFAYTLYWCEIFNLSYQGTDGVEYLLIPLDETILKQFIEEQENS